jgi:hypothetical protein
MVSIKFSPFMKHFLVLLHKGALQDWGIGEIGKSIQDLTKIFLSIILIFNYYSSIKFSSSL